MKPFINILLCLLDLQLIAQEPVWIQLEDNFPYNGSNSKVGIDQNDNIYAISSWTYLGSYNNGSCIVKYLPDGTKEWLCNYQTDSLRTESVHIDSFGNTYIAKRRLSWTIIGGLLKVNYNGELEYYYQEYDIVYCDVKADNLGNAYVTGVSFEPEHDMELILIKFNSNGIKEWQTYWDIPGDFTRGQKILLDEEQNIYVVGNFHNSQIESLILAKYNPDGILLDHTLFLIEIWTMKLIFHFALDNDENIYVTGRYEETETWWKRGYIYKFNSTLTEQWHDTITLPFNSFTDFVIDENKNVILSGFEEHDPYDNPHATYAKYDQDGNKLWHFTNDSIKSRINSIVTYNNNYFLTGRLRNEEKYSYEYISMRLNSEGEVIDTHLLESVDSTYNVGVDNVIDHNGNLICTGIYEDTVDYCLTVKYDAITFEEEIISRKDENLQVYPNPAKSILNVEFNCNESIGFVILLYNMAGIKIKESAKSNSIAGNNTVKIDLSGIPQGVYILSIKYPDKVISEKVIVTD